MNTEYYILVGLIVVSYLIHYRIIKRIDTKGKVQDHIFSQIRFMREFQAYISYVHEEKKNPIWIVIVIALMISEIGLFLQIFLF